ncbi:MAG: undecaprenyl-diphosphate phosphatase, partial [Planctomycetaceae bacterium]|nr:undecaprenyl-diphosphate phosphatase [Planctomycetaceae bacterium]
VVYWKDLLELRSDLRTIGLIILATIPVGIAGIMFKDQIEALMSSPLPVGFALIVTAVVLLISQRLQRDALTIREVSWPTVAIIGLFQAVAILPGISRSGSTIAGGLLCGLQRSEATRFSFLIAIPAIGGATIVKAKDLLSGEAAVSAQEIGPLAVGTVVSFLVGLVALKALIRVVSANRLHWFAGYCLTAGLATVAWQLLG